jgi:hypothetical protein
MENHFDIKWLGTAVKRAAKLNKAERSLPCLKRLRNHRLGVMENSHNSCRRGARQILLEDGSQPFITRQTVSKELPLLVSSLRKRAHEHRYLRVVT